MIRRGWGRVLLAVTVALLAVAASAEDPLDNVQEKPWRPGGTGIEIPLWPDGMAIAYPATKDAEFFGTSRDFVAGRHVEVVENVTRPTMAIYPAKGNNTGVSVLVFPGGGYRILAIDLEGTEVCDWLTAKGITCAVLKYRIPGSGPYWNADCHCRKIPSVPMALQDAQRALGILRQRAGSFGMDPHKVGVLGFSAGGHLVADVSNHDRRSYPPVDQADRQSSVPDFAIALYPGHLWMEPGLTLNPSVTVSAKTPPTFILQAENDTVDDVRHSLTYYLALERAKVPVEMHLYAEGGHGFGLRPNALPIGEWPSLVEKWLRTIGMVPKDS
jgi:acetyl esterase/lipase